MGHGGLLRMGFGLALLAALSGCDKFHSGNADSGPDGAPTDQELQKIGYMSSTDTGPNGRKLYNRFEEARTCADFELAMRWNRPPNVAGGPFHQKVAYLTATVPADLPKGAEVFITGTIEKWETLPSGASGWYLRMADGTVVQAIESAGFWEKQEQASQDGKVVALVSPNVPGRKFCGQGAYQGLGGKHPELQQKLPLVAVFYAMDRKAEDVKKSSSARHHAKAGAK